MVAQVGYTVIKVGLSGKFWSGKIFGPTGPKFSEIIKNFGPPLKILVRHRLQMMAVDSCRVQIYLKTNKM